MELYSTTGVVTTHPLPKLWTAGAWTYVAVVLTAAAGASVAVYANGPPVGGSAAFPSLPAETRNGFIGRGPQTGVVPSELFFAGGFSVFQASRWLPSAPAVFVLRLRRSSPSSLC